jgi:hypothetical protein
MEHHGSIPKGDCVAMFFNWMDPSKGRSIDLGFDCMWCCFAPLTSLVAASSVCLLGVAFLLRCPQKTAADEKVTKREKRGTWIASVPIKFYRVKTARSLWSHSSNGTLSEKDYQWPTPSLRIAGQTTAVAAALSVRDDGKMKKCRALLVMIYFICTSGRKKRNIFHKHHYYIMAHFRRLSLAIHLPFHDYNAVLFAFLWTRRLDSTRCVFFFTPFSADDGLLLITNNVCVRTRPPTLAATHNNTNDNNNNDNNNNNGA